MALEVVLRTSDPYEAQSVCDRLKAVGIDAVLQGAAQASLLGVGQHLIEQLVLVPQEQLAQAKAFFDSKLVLDGTQPTGESLADAVCAVHEEPAVATCARCGNFLCAKCGSLGTPPLCEDCVERHEPPVARGTWAKNLAKGYLLLYSLGIGLAVLVTLVVLFKRFAD
ncbi:MAG: hypothetical protein IT380_19740 [Myxococcales bacterium]|nr:hypothetical protein [Myxococcales bacterium]